MLPTQPFEKTNFADGMLFNPEQIKLNDTYYSQKHALIARYGIGSGILVGFKSNLRVSVENSKLVLHPGAAIDQNGELIFVHQKNILLKDVNISQFKDATTIYIYIKYKENLTDQKESRRDRDQKHYYKVEEGYSVELREKVLENSSLFELARIHIEHKHSTHIKEAANPYSPIENEIDLRFCTKIVSPNSIMNYNEKIMIANIFRKYADFLTEMSYKKQSYSASLAATFANKIVSDIKVFDLSAAQIYDILQHLLYVSSKIQDEMNEIVNTAFWKNILRLQSIFAFNENYEISYYDLLLNIDSSFFSKVLLHFGNAAIFDGNWDEVNNDENEVQDKEDKGYLKVGSAADCDLIVEGDDIAPFHAKLYPYRNGYFIEDVSDSSGIYVNAERLGAGVKKFIRHQDFTCLGKNGKVLNLTHL